MSVTISCDNSSIYRSSQTTLTVERVRLPISIAYKISDVNNSLEKRQMIVLLYIIYVFFRLFGAIRFACFRFVNDGDSEP